MKTNKPMRNTPRATAGFTLIELMIVVAIIGILASVAIPNFLKARDRSKFMRCVGAIAGLKVAQEMYINVEDKYADRLDLLAMYWIPSCTDRGGADCTGEVEDRLQRNCTDADLVIMEAGYDFEIVATADERFQCKICMGPRGYEPEKYSQCTSVWTMNQACNDLQGP